MSRKLYTIYALKRPYTDGFKYVVYKWEHGEVSPTYYTNKKVASEDKNNVCR